MNKKRKTICILIILFLFILLGGAIVFVQWDKTTVKKKPSVEEEIKEGTIIIEKGDPAPVFETEEFTDKTTEKSEKSEKEILGGSETISVNSLTAEETEEQQEESTGTEWLPGIW